MINFRFIFNRRGKLNSNNEASLEIELYQTGGKRAYKSTGILITKDQWDEKRSQVKKHPKAQYFNSIIQDYIFKIETEINPDSTVNSILDALDSNYNKRSFLDFMATEIKNQPLKKQTKVHQQAALNHMIRHGKIKNFADLTYENIEALDNYLRDKGLIQNSIYHVHKRFKKFINLAVTKGIIDYGDNPYLKFKPKSVRRSIPRYLDPEELNKIETTTIVNKHLSRVRDIFIFQTYTGMAYNELTTFSKSDIISYKNEFFIAKSRGKTEVEFYVLLLPKAIKILEKYDYILPVISNQKYNTYLGEVAELCEIEKKVTSHVARHTFATTVTLLNGIPLETVSKMLGHTNTTTTQIYSKVNKDKILKDMQKLKMAMTFESE